MSSAYQTIGSWLQLHPQNIIDQEYSGRYFMFLLKNVHIYYIKFRSPTTGRRCYEEFILATDDGCIMPFDPYWDAIRAKRDGAETYDEWCNNLKRVYSELPQVTLDGVNALHHVNPNYGHMIADFLPASSAISEYAKTKKIESIRHICGKVHDEIRDIFNLASLKGSFCDMGPLNLDMCKIVPDILLLPVFLSRADMISMTRTALEPLLNTARKIIDQRPARKRSLVISYRKNALKQRILFSEEGKDLLLRKGAMFVDFTEFSLLQTALVINSQHKFLFSIGAEITNLLFLHNPMATSIIAVSSVLTTDARFLRYYADSSCYTQTPPMLLVGTHHTWSHQPGLNWNDYSVFIGNELLEKLLR